MGCPWSRPIGSQTPDPALSHNHRASNQSSPAPSVPSQRGGHHRGFRSRIAKVLGFLSRNHTAKRPSQENVSSGGTLPLAPLEQISSKHDSQLLTLFEKFNVKVQDFACRTQPEDERQRRQTCIHIYDQVIGFLRDEKRPPREYKTVATTLTQVLCLPKIEPFETNPRIVAICRYGEQMKKAVLASDCDYTFEYPSEETQDRPVLKEDGRPVMDKGHRPAYYDVQTSTP